MCEESQRIFPGCSENPAVGQHKKEMKHFRRQQFLACPEGVLQIRRRIFQKWVT